MAVIADYLNKYGAIGFDEIPLNECDILALTKLAYVQFEKVASGDFDADPEPFLPLLKKMRYLEGGQFLRHGLWLGDDASRFPELLLSVTRYADIRVLACRGVDREKPAVQFGVQTYILPDGRLFVPFRGTNDSIFGWKEDFDILAKKGIPSYTLALDYLDDLVKRFPEGELIVSGHSKGGNVALYAAMHTTDAIRKRISALYNFDGPGFWDDRYLSTPNYKDLLPRYHHYLPQSSMIGLMLAHDEDYKIANSTQFLGVMQHDVSTWQVDGTKLDTLPAFTKLGQFTDIFMRAFSAKLTPEQIASWEQILEGAIEASGERTLLALSKNAGFALKGARDVWRGAAPGVRALAKAAFRGTGKLALQAFQSVHRTASTAIEIAADLLPV